VWAPIFRQGRAEHAHKSCIAEPARSAARKHTEINNKLACYLPAIACAGLEAPLLVRDERRIAHTENVLKKDQKRKIGVGSRQYAELRQTMLTDGTRVSARPRVPGTRPFCV
jgi:hypothetical protein